MNKIKEFTDLLKNLSTHEIIDDLKNYTNNKDKYDILLQENNELKLKLQSCMEENTNLNKVSYVRSLSTEIANKDKYIKQLEAQIETLKKNKANVLDTNTEVENIEIDGYDIIKYKKVYYLVNDENKVFTIVNNKPDVIIGILVNGKVKLQV
jgi:seryl-tRNA synthetase